MTVIAPPISYGHLSDFLKSDFLFHIHFSVVICDFLVKSSQITIVLMHVSFIKKAELRTINIYPI